MDNWGKTLRQGYQRSGREILFVRQFYIPDGHDGEGREQYVKSLLSKAEKDKRFADPVVCILNLKTKKLIEVDYGWAPGFSSDDKRIVYSYQTIPISGKRVLAETLNGNKIKIYNRSTKQYEIIASPDKTFLLDPKFLDNSTVSYKIGDAVNGAYGGGIAFNKINLVTRKIEIIYPIRNNYGLFNWLGDMNQNDRDIYYTVYMPQDSGSFMARSYSHLLFSSSGRIHDFGKMPFKNLDSKYAKDQEGNLMYLDDDIQWITEKKLLIKYKGDKLVSKKELSKCMQLSGHTNQIN